MAEQIIPQLTATQADDLISRAIAAGKLGWLEHRTLSALVGGYPPAAEHNLMTVWQALQRRQESLQVAA